VASIFAISIVLALNIFCFYRSVNGFFLADDFSHIDYLHQVFAGHPELLIENFYSNWLQAQGTKFFRPFISVTLAWDYLFWKNNPLGFHLTNLGYQIASSVLIFFIVKRLFPISKARSFWLGLASASLFSVNPLHPEVVSWIIARVDSVATTFMLAAFYLYQRGCSIRSSKSKFFKFAATFSFLISLLSKEMAVSLPAVLFVWRFLFPDVCIPAEEVGDQGEDRSESSERNFTQRCKIALRETWLYWVMLASYLIYRSVCLGTIIGGYGGAVGEGLQHSFWHRWSDPQSLQRIFFPFNDEAFQNSSRLGRFLRWVYQLSAVVFLGNCLLALKQGRLNLYARMIFFAMCWFALAMMPTYQVWNLSSNLQGARFIYMGSVPLAVLFGLLVLPVFDLASARQLGGAFLLLAYISISAVITQKNNSAWYHASRGVQALYKAVNKQLETMPADQSMILLNLPFRYQGAHMLYNGFTFGALLRPPFTTADNSKRVILFEPIEFGEPDLINVSRLRSVVESKTRPLIFRWDEKENKLRSISLAWSPTKVELSNQTFAHIAKDMTLFTPIIDVSPAGIDYLDICFKVPSGQKPQFLKLSWSGSSFLFSPDKFLWAKLDPVSDAYQVRVYLSEHKKWLSSERISRLGFQFYPCPVVEYKISDLVVKSGNLSDVPKLFAGVPADPKSSGMVQDSLGMAHPQSRIGYLCYDASRVASCDHVVFQISKVDSWFEQSADTFRSSEVKSDQYSLSQDFKEFTGNQVCFSSARFKAPGFYEVRVGAVSKDGKILSTYSDPINFYLSEADIRNAK
jgi:hypothetical protein